MFIFHKKKRNKLKQKYISLFIISVLLLNLMIGIFPLKIYAYNTQNIDYNYETDSLYNNTNINPNEFEYWNIRNQTQVSQDYNATYSFDNENELNDWIPYGNIDYGIIDNYLGHNNILKVNTTETGSMLANTFDTIKTGINTIEFWICRPNLNYQQQLYFLSTVNVCLALFFNNGGSCTWSKSGGTYPTIINMLANKWYHFKVQIDVDTNPDTINIWINGVLKANNESSYYNRNNLKSMRFNYGNAFPCIIYYDAIGYSWDSTYQIGQNIVPTYEQSTNLECDKYEFALQSYNILNPNGLDNPNGWIDLETSGHDQVNIADQSTNDKRVNILYGGLTSYDPLGLTHSFTTLDSYVYNITWRFEYATATASLDALNNLDVYSNDSTLITRIRFFNDVYDYQIHHRLQYYDGSDYNNLTIGIIGYQWYTMNLYINYYDNIAHLILNNGSNYYYTFPLITTGKSGINQVQYYMDDHSGHYTMNIYLDSIGIYENGLSISNENGYMTLETNESLDYQIHTLFYSDTTGYVNISGISGSYTVQETTYPFINKTLGFTGYQYKYINIDFLYSGSITDLTLLFYVCNYYDDIYLGLLDTRNFNISSIRIEGITLIQSLYGYQSFMTFSSATNYYQYKNMFYIENSRLYFNLTCSDTSLEYINCLFDIQNIYTRNFSIQLKNNFIESHYTYIIMNLEYYDSNIYSESYNYTGFFTISYILDQNKVLDSFNFNITDNDNNLASGWLTHGYLNKITLQYSGSIPLTLTTLTLIQSILPLLIILPMAIGSREIFKKEKEKELISLFFIGLGSLICYLAQLISYQIFGLLIFGFIFIIMNKRKKENSEP